MARPRLIERERSRFLRGPMSVGSAANVIVVVTGAVVILGGIVMRLIDGDEYPSIWRGMWFALQTVTTVGYGDVTPQEPSGRIVGALIMFEGVAFLTVVVASITSIFVARERKELQAELDEDTSRASVTLHGRFDELEARLDRLETTLSRLASD